MKINKRGFAVSTMLYGLIFLTIAVFYMIIKLENTRQIDNKNYVEEVRNSLQDL